MKAGIVLAGTAMVGLLALFLWSEERVAAAADDARGEEITVLAAAGLLDVLERLGEEFQRSHGVRVRLDFASSGILRGKIHAGARADVFLSASSRDMDLLDAEGCLASETRRDFLRNSLACVVPVTSSQVVAAPEDLLNDGVRRIAVGDPGHVPAGYHAEEALRHFNLAKRLQNKLLPCADVRAALAQAEAGTVDAALVYASDARVSKKVKVAFTFPREKEKGVRLLFASLERLLPQAD